MKILLTGATGFVGSEVLKQTLAAGHQVRILVRDLEAATREIGLDAGVEFFHGNLLYAPSLAGCMEGVDTVVHLVGIITEVDEMTFDAVHRAGTVNLLGEAKKAKVKRWIHMSALGTRADARSRYHRSKWAGEEALRASNMDWTIMRPSFIYGPGDQSVNFFARMMKFPLNVFQLFTVPLIGGGLAKVQPVPVEDVARCFVSALTKHESVKKTYDVCGPAALPFREMIGEIAAALGKRATVVRMFGARLLGDWAAFLLPVDVAVSLLSSKPLLVPVPYDFATALAWLLENMTERPALNRDQVLMLEEDNVGNPEDSLRDFGIQPPPFRDGVRKYLNPG